MKVTKVTVSNVNPKKSGVCADAEIIINGELCIKKIHVIQGEKGLFVAFPNTGETRLRGNKRCFEDLVHPISSNLREMISAEVLNAYNKALG